MSPFPTSLHRPDAVPCRWTRIAGAMLPAVLWALTACGPSGGPAPGAAESSRDGSYEIAVIPKSTSHDFWKSIHAGALQAQEAINGAGKVRIEIIWKGPLTEEDATEQINLVNTFVSRGVDGIVLAPVDKASLVRPAADAMKAGIPVVVMDSGLDGQVGRDYVAYVATDNRKGGALGARRLAAVLGGKGRVILLRYQVGSESTIQREEGFLAALKAEFPAIEVVSSDQYAGGTEELAFQKSQRLLTRLGQEVDGIFCPNESATAGMLGALKQSGLAGKIRFVGFDASPKLIVALRRGEIHGLVLQHPVKMAAQAVETLVRRLQGETVAPFTDTGVEVITPENVGDPAMAALHSPDLSRWLKE